MTTKTTTNISWNEITNETIFPETMSVVKAFSVCNGFTGGKEYTSAPWCVWLKPYGSFARWPHHFKPTHWFPLPEDKNE